MLNEISEIPPVLFTEYVSQHSSWRQMAHTLKELTKEHLFIKGLFTKVWVGFREVQAWQQSVITFAPKGMMRVYFPEPTSTVIMGKVTQ